MFIPEMSLMFYLAELSPAKISPLKIYSIHDGVYLCIFMNEFELYVNFQKWKFTYSFKFFVFTLYLLAALNISNYKTELQNNRVLTVWRVFWIPMSCACYEEQTMCPPWCSSKCIVLTLFRGFEHVLSKDLTICLTVCSPNHSQLNGMQNTLHTVSTRLLGNSILSKCLRLIFEMILSRHKTPYS